MLSKPKKGWLALTSSLLLLSALAFMLVGRADLYRVSELLSRISLNEFVSAVALMIFVGFWESPRSQAIMEADGARGVSRGTLYRIALIRQFIVYAAPVSALADVAKAAMIALRVGLPATKAASYVLYERIIGVLCVAVLGLLALPLQAMLGVPIFWLLAQSALWLGGLAVAGGLIWFSFRDLPEGTNPIDRLLRVAHGLGLQLKNPAACVKQVGFMLLQLGGMAGVFAVLAHAMHVPLDYVEVLAFIPLIFFFSSLPVFYAGWGGREAIFTATFGVYGGVAATDSFSVSVTYGLVVFVAALPGAVLWAMRPSMRKRLHKDPAPISQPTQA